MEKWGWGSRNHCGDEWGKAKACWSAKGQEGQGLFSESSIQVGAWKDKGRQWLGLEQPPSEL